MKTATAFVLFSASSAAAWTPADNGLDSVNVDTSKMDQVAAGADGPEDPLGLGAGPGEDRVLEGTWDHEAEPYPETCEAAVEGFFAATEMFVQEYNMYGTACGGDEGAIATGAACIDDAMNGYAEINDYYDAIAKYGADLEGLGECVPKLAMCSDVANKDLPECSCEQGSLSDCEFYECNRLVLYFLDAISEINLSHDLSDSSTKSDVADDACIDGSRADCFAYFAYEDLVLAADSCYLSFSADCVDVRDAVWYTFQMGCRAYSAFNDQCGDVSQWDNLSIDPLKDEMYMQYCAMAGGDQDSCEEAVQQYDYCVEDVNMLIGIENDAKLVMAAFEERAAEEKILSLQSKLHAASLEKSATRQQLTSPNTNTKNNAILSRANKADLSSSGGVTTTDWTTVPIFGAAVGAVVVGVVSGLVGYKAGARRGGYSQL